MKRKKKKEKERKKKKKEEKKKKETFELSDSINPISCSPRTIITSSILPSHVLYKIKIFRSQEEKKRKEQREKRKITLAGTHFPN